MAGLLSCQLTIAILAIGYPHLNYFVGGLGSFNAMFTIVSGYASCDSMIAKYTIILDKLETLHVGAVNMTTARITAELNAIIGREAPYVSDYFLDKAQEPDDMFLYNMEKVFHDE